MYENSNCELASMDGKLPVMIYSILNSKFLNEFAPIHFEGNFCNTDPIIELIKVKLQLL